jgi:hypothetical protein
MKHPNWVYLDGRLKIKLKTGRSRSEKSATVLEISIVLWAKTSFKAKIQFSEKGR